MIRGSFLARRINSARLLLGTITLTVLITAALGAALASFAAQSLPQAVRAQLIGSPDLSVAVSGSMTASQVGPASRAVRASLGGALSGVPYEIDRALWSDPLGLPAPKGGAAVPIVQVAEVQRIQEHAVLTAGAWPGAPGRGRPIGVALPALAARELHAGPGTILRTSDRITNARVPLLVTGVYRVKDPAAGYWRLDLIATSGVSVQAPFVSYGPAVASPAAFGSGGLAVGKASWIVLPDGTAIGDDRLSPLAAKVSGAAASLQASNNLGGIGVSTGMPRLLDGLATSLVVARSLVVIGALQLLLLAAAALALAARLLARHREEESALLGARGATRWQLARPTLVETLVFGGLAAAAGVLAGTRLAALLVRLTESGRGLNVSGIPASAWWAAAAALVLAAVVVLWPALRPGGAAPRRGRQAALAGLARAGADLVLLALAVVAVWELHTYSAVAHSATGGLGVDPVIAVAPALALAAVTAVSLRLLPAAARLLERVAAQGRRLAAALAGWQISRRPLRQSGPFLLVILATAAATLALAQYQSASGSADDQAAFAVGADLRADVAAPLALPAAGQIARSPGIRAVTPVTTTGAGQVGELIALDAHAAPATVLLRSDLSPVPAPQLWQRLVPARAPGGLAIPGRPASLTMTARLTPGSAALVPGPATVTLSVQDADGIVYLVGAGTLPADGRTHELTASLSPARQAAYPLRLLGLSFDYTLPVYPPSRPAAAYVPPQHGPQARLDLGALTAGPGGQPFATGVALRTWGIGTSATGLSASGQPTTAIAAAADGARPWLTSWKRAGAGQELLFSAGFTPSADSIAENNEVDAGFTGELTIAAGPPAGPVPAIATSSFLRNADGHVGSVLPVPVGGVTILMRVVASVSEFPTIGSGSALIVDQAPVQAILAAHSATPLPVTQWWLATGGTAVPAALRGASVTSRAAQTAALMRNPLSELPRQAALAIGLAAVLLAAIGFSISVAASAAARRGENAVLSALGVARSAQAGQLCLEQLLLSVPAAAGGLLVGSGLARLVVPAITLTATAGRPFPPVLVRVPLGWAALLALVLAALPVLAAAVTTARRPDPAAELRAAEAS